MLVLSFWVDFNGGSHIDNWGTLSLIMMTWHVDVESMHLFVFINMLNVMIFV